MSATASRFISRAGASGDSHATAVVTCALRNPEDSLRVCESVDARALADVAHEHRVLVLLGSQLRSAGTLERWPPAFRDAFVVAERDAATLDCIRCLELTRVVDALAAAGIRALLFKGAALAHTVYSAPYLRPRTDADILIESEGLRVVEGVLESLGYRPQHETSGLLVSYQNHYGKRDRYGVFHALDVHWKISNRHALADRFGFEELWADRLPLPALGRSAASVSTVHALLLALVHRAGHHPGSSNLLWIYDLHALASRMTDGELDDVARLAVSRGLAALASDGLSLARDSFGTLRLDSPIRTLKATSQHLDAIPAIPDRWRQAGIVGHDLQALTTWGARGRLLREHLFPSPTYIRGKYGIQSTLLLPALYAWRIVSGAPRWLRRHDNEAG